MGERDTAAEQCTNTRPAGVAATAAMMLLASTTTWSMDDSGSSERESRWYLTFGTVEGGEAPMLRTSVMACVERKEAEAEVRGLR